MYVYVNLNFVCSISMTCLWLDYQKKYRRNSNIKKFIVFNHCERSIAVIIIIIKMGFRLPPTLSMDYGQFFTRIQFWQVFVLIIFFVLLRAGYFFSTPNIYLICHSKNRLRFISDIRRRLFERTRTYILSLHLVVVEEPDVSEIDRQLSQNIFQVS